MAVSGKFSSMEILCLCVVVFSVSLTPGDGAPRSLSGTQNSDPSPLGQQFSQHGESGRAGEVPFDATDVGRIRLGQPAHEELADAAQTPAVDSATESTYAGAATQQQQEQESGEDFTTGKHRRSSEDGEAFVTRAALALHSLDSASTFVPSLNLRPSALPKESTLATATGDVTAGVVPGNDHDVTTSLPVSEVSRDENPWIDEGVETVPFVWSGTRLPQDVMPLHYDLTVQPHIYEGPDDLYHVSGSIDIHLLCHAATDIIILHAQAIKLAQVSIEGEQVYGPSVVRYGYDARNNMVAVNLSEPLVPGAQYILSIGYFKASFAETESTWVRYGYSQYVYDDEACGATVPGKFLMTFTSPAFSRKNFPCFDEPRFKTTYNISVVHKPSMTAFSNMPVWHQEMREEGMMVSHFETSPPMDTYLVELMLADGQLWCRERTWRRIKIRVCSRRSQLHKTTHLLHLAPSLINWLEEFTGVAYPLPKLDFVAAPTKQGLHTVAMEHWGIITASEFQMLYHPQEDSVLSLLWVNKIASHEVTHQVSAHTVVTTAPPLVYTLVDARYP